MESDENSTGNRAHESGLSYVPQCNIVPTLHKTILASKEANIAVIDMGALRNGSVPRSRVIEDIRHACCHLGFFQIVNHGISQSVLDEAISVASSFFDLPLEEKVEFMSNDVHKPIRYGSFQNEVDNVQFCRLFLKHYAHPLRAWIHMWPQNPPDYREKMGRCCQEVKKASLKVVDAIIESLEINPTFLTKKIEDGVQVTALNFYPTSPKTNEIVVGVSPHSDHSCLTLVHQSCPGLEIMDLEDGTWKLVPHIPGALQVHVGDHFEVLSNGLYKSVVHRATLNKESTRISIASLFSLGMDDKVEAARELVDEQHPQKYRESSFRDFLNFLASNEMAKGKTFLDTIKIIN